MKLIEFDAAVDAIEIDPRPRLKRCAASVIHTRLRLVGLNEDQIERFADPALKQLLQSAKAIEQDSFDFDKCILEFDQALLQRVRYEREHGELKPVTADSQIKDHQQILRDRLYQAYELDAVRRLIRPGERILSVGWWEIETTSQVILRRDLSKVNRPISFRNGSEWRKQFVSAAQVEDAIAAEERRKQPIRGQTVSPWVE